MKRIYKVNKDNKINNDIINFDTKHKLMINSINNQKDELNNIIKEIDIVKNKINNINLNDLNNMKDRALLLDKLDELNIEYNNLNSNYNEINYYNNVGDLIINYYELKNYNNDMKEKRDILDFLSNNTNNIYNNNNEIFSKKNILLDKYCKRLTGFNTHNYLNNVKLCNECKIEKILNINDSSFICPYCGDSEYIIIVFNCIILFFIFKLT